MQELQLKLLKKEFSNLSDMLKRIKDESEEASHGYVDEVKKLQNH